MSKKKRKGPWGVFLAIVLAALFGSIVGKEGSIFGVSFYSIVDALGRIFLNALTLVVVPLVSSSIISGISRIGNDSDFGRLGRKIFSFYIGTSLLAVLIGLFYVNLIRPGSSESIPSTVGSQVIEMEHLQEQIAGNQGEAFMNLIYSIVPSNVLAAFSQGEMLGLIFFSLLFGFALSKIGSDSGKVIQHFFQGIFQTMIGVTHLIMKVLPYGVFCLVSKVFMTTGVNSIRSMALFSMCVIVGLVTFMFVALPLLLRFIGKVNPIRQFKAMSPAIVTAFSTSSSSATLPITMDCVEKRAGVSNRICSLVVPLGTSVNMSGSALYECVAAMYIAQAYGVDFSITTQFLVVIMALISSIGVAGIPSASLVALIVILKVIGLPPEGIGLFIAVDRLLDMFRTTVNVFSDSCCAVLVARSEGESGVLAHDPIEE